MNHHVQLAVEYADHQTRYYPANRGWRIDAAQRCIVIGRDLPRTYVPLDGVVGFTVERVDQADSDPDAVRDLLDEAREQLLTELTGGKRPCPWCNGAPVFDSAEELLTHTRRHHLAPFPPDELVWLGELSGYQLDPDDGNRLLLRHRCGWTYEVDNPVSAYLANLIDGPVAAHRDAGCNPHED